MIKRNSKEIWQEVVIKPWYICWSPNWNEPHTAMGTPRFGLLTLSLPIPIRGVPIPIWGFLFLCFFQSRTRSAFSHQKLRQSQHHGAPLLTKNLGNQHTSPANQELGEQEKRRLLLPSQIEGVVQPKAQPPHLAQTTTQQQLQLSPFLT